MTSNQSRFLELLKTNNIAELEYFFNEHTDTDVNFHFYENFPFFKKITPLVYAASLGYIDIVRLLLQNGAAIDGTDIHGNTALIEAASKGHTEITRLLIDHNAKVNTTGFYKNTPLIAAATSGHNEIIKLLLEKGADIGAANTNNETAFIRAAMHGNIDTLKLLAKYPNVSSISNPLSSISTALIESSAQGHTDIVKFLLDNYPDTRKDLNVALIKASNSGETKTVELLLKNGANVNAQDKYGYTPLIQACDRGHIETVELLLKNGANVNAKDNHANTALITASSHKDFTEIIEVLLKYGADVNAINNDGDSALIMSVDIGFTMGVKLLIENGADINIRTKPNSTTVDPLDGYGSGHTPLILALQSGYDEIAKMLKLSKATQSMDLSTIKELLTNESDIISNYSKKDLSLALILSLYYNQPQITSIIMDQKEHLNLFIQDNSGWDLLMAASYAGNEDIVSIILNKYQHIPDPQICINNYHSNALILAAYAGHANIVSILLQSNLFDINQKNIFGTTPLIAAIYSGKNDIVKQLLLNENLKLNPSSISELFLIFIAFSYSMFVHQNFSIPAMIFERLHNDQSKNKKESDSSRSSLTRSDNITPSSFLGIFNQHRAIFSHGSPNNHNNKERKNKFH